MEPMDLSEWVKRMEAAARKDRQAIVEELAKALGVPAADAWKKLSEAGWNPKKAKPSGDSPDKDPPDGPSGGNGKKQTVTLRHKTSYPQYRRAGLVLTSQFKPYEVTVEQLEVFKHDPWVEVGK